jgi:mannosyltransferase
MTFPKSLTSLLLLLLGSLLVALAIIVSGADYSQMLLGENAKDLSWGAPLFRMLLAFHGLLLIGVSFYWTQLTANNSETEKIKVEKTSSLIWISLIVLSVIALGLRLWHLNSDLWVDEVLTLVDYARKPFGEILTSFPNQNQHMLFSVLARTSFDIFGESAWALRLPSVLFGVGSIWAMFFLCRKLLGVKEALLASALMTVSYHHIWFSQNARGYMGLLFFTLLATWFWFEALEKKKWRWWFAYSAAIVLGMWIHMTMAFVVAAHGLVYLALLFSPKLSGDKTFSLERRAGIKPFVAWFLSVTVTLQLYALALPEFLRIGLHEESKNSEWTNPLWVLTETIQNLSIGFAGIAVVICGGAFVAFGWLMLFRKNRRAAVLMVLPPIFAGTFMLALGHNLFPRFFFFAMGFALLIVIHGAVELPKFLSNLIGKFENKSAIPNAIGVTLVTLMILASITTVPRNYALPKQNFSGARDYVENQRLPGEKVVAVSIAGMMYEKLFAPSWSVAETGADLENIQEKSEKIWLIYTLSPEIKAFHPDMWQMIEKDYEVVKIFPGTLNGGEIFVCQKRTVREEKNESSRNFSQIENAPVRQTTPDK